MRKENTFTEEQIKGARQLCGILNEAPNEKRNIFLAIANAYMDGMAAGATVVAAAGNTK